MTISSESVSRARSAASRRAYSSAAAGSWIEHGPTTTSSRLSLPRRMSWMRLRVAATSASTGVPWIGKKRIRCSGGGSSTMSATCSSSVRDVRSSRRTSPSVSRRFGVVIVFRHISRRSAHYRRCRLTPRGAKQSTPVCVTCHVAWPTGHPRNTRSPQTGAVGFDPRQDHSRRAQMTKTLLIVAIGATLATTAAAQSRVTPASPEEKAKQEMVQSATASTAKGYGLEDAEGSAAAAKTNGMPKALPDEESKRKAVNSLTQSTAGKQYGQASAEGSARAAADTSPRKVRPKMSDYEKELQKASKP